MVRCDSKSTSHTGNMTIPENKYRNYFFIVMVSGNGTIEFGKGGGKIPIAEGSHYQPPVAPTGEITIETTGTYVIHQA